MKNVEFYETVKELLAGNDEIVAYCDKELEKEANRKAKDAERRAAKAAEDAPLYDALRNALSSEPQFASELAEQIGVSTSKASAMLRKVADDWGIVKGIAKNGKSKAMTYAVGVVAD